MKKLVNSSVLKVLSIILFVCLNFTVTNAQQKKTTLINPDDAVFLFVDHQSGLVQTVHSMPVGELRRNLSALAKASQLLRIPAIYTASVPTGPNGPTLPEVKDNAPNAKYVNREGEINAWDSKEFVNAVKATGKKTLIISGMWTSVCVVYPALSALGEGYTVYAVADASGDITPEAHNLAMLRLTEAGAIPITVGAMLPELMKDWRRKEAGDFAKILAELVPNFQAVIEQYYKAQEVAKSQK
ncbi:isochorismatase family protein [Ohtaekwangia koreensis]|uniref:Nicotinamidase-related amidase n=1 Tax=Ohtaekwangia koreensis TaxID=688867 RepID=A0A1T5M573_9BACT|nr:isochorismatase family protein [Ohtaekwangia koreensis]SKC83382.1 Nicotinamidase-related amidase [Ohtaekwangia koreensis]